MQSRMMILAGAAVFALGAAGASAADTFPSRPIELVLPAAPGGTTDLAVRVMANRWQEFLGQPVVVVNKPGAGGAIGANFVAQAKPDGYTLLGAFDSLLIALPLVNKSITYNLDSFDYISGFGIGAIYLMTRADSPWKTIGDFLEGAKAKRLSYASYGVGVITHFTAERLFALAGVDLTYIPYKSSPESATAMLGRHVDLAVTAGTGGVGQSPDVRILAVATEQRRPDRPNVPTLKEQGFDVSLDYISSVLAPKGLPPAVKAKLEGAIQKANDKYEAEFAAQLIKGDLIFVKYGGEEVRKRYAERSKWFGEVLPRVTANR